MSWSVILYVLSFAVLGAACASPALRRYSPKWHWYLLGYPATALRVWFSWRRVAVLCDLAVARIPSRALLGNLVVKGDPLRPEPPRIGVPRPLPGGLAVRVTLHPGQTPAAYLAAADALTHAWRVHSVRVTTPARGRVLITATATDPLADPRVPNKPVGLLSALVGALENGSAWIIDLLRVPHWLIIGATRSGKSTLLSSLVCQLAPQRVALVGIDCKGGMELSLFEPRLSALACNRQEAAELLERLVVEVERRMAVCRAAGVRSIWEMPEISRPVPVVVVVDELAELYLSDGSREDKALSARCSTALVRLAQLGAALGVHLVVAGQRVGSELGPGVTALRAQLAGRVCHRVNDPGTAEMALGDLSPDAITVAQAITADEQGVAVTTDEHGAWTRARSTLTTTDRAKRTARDCAHLTPDLPALREEAKE
ncbi:FtsK/SpoIIIE domain-containing protein [Streptomyces capparidis]